jgi:hypothetical protein
MTSLANCALGPSIMEVANTAGLLSLNPSDLVFESSQMGIAYYDFVLSSSEIPATPTKGATAPPSSYQLFLAKLDPHTNVEWFETATVNGEVLVKNGIPASDLSMITMGILLWRDKLAKSKLLCLVNYLTDECSVGLEALKRATNKFKCMHHVLTIGSRRASSTSTGSQCSSSSFRSSISNSSQV